MPVVGMPKGTRVEIRWSQYPISEINLHRCLEKSLLIVQIAKLKAERPAVPLILDYRTDRVEVRWKPPLFTTKELLKASLTWA